MDIENAREVVPLVREEALGNRHQRGNASARGRRFETQETFLLPPPQLVRKQTCTDSENCSEYRDYRIILCGNDRYGGEKN